MKILGSHAFGKNFFGAKATGNNEKKKKKLAPEELGNVVGNIFWRLPHDFLRRP